MSRQNRWALSAVAALLLALPLAGCAGVPGDSRTTLAAADPALGYVNAVSQTAYTACLRDLLYCHKGANRHGGLREGPQHDLARDAILARLKSFGLSAAVEHVVVNGLPADNVVAVQRGASRPNDLYIISAHYDSAGTPGADDDGSGVAAVLEAARVMAGHPSEATIYFIAFDGEELDCVGSLGWVRSHTKDTVRGMVTADMIAYNPAGSAHNRAKIYARWPKRPWAAGMTAAVAAYGGLPTVAVAAPYEGDYWAFERRGWPGCMVIERADNSNYRYHTARDSYDIPGYLDMTYATKMTRGIVGYFAKVAGFSPIAAGAL